MKLALELDRSVWKRVKFGDVVEQSKEKVDPADGTVSRVVAGEHMDSDDLRIHRWGGVDDGYLGPAFHRRFRPGQVLYGSRRTYLRKVAVADFDGVCSNTTFVLSSKDENQLLPGFLPWVMTSEAFHSFAIAESKGSVNPYVNFSDITRYEFALPPIDQQRSIADLCWALERHSRKLSSVTSTIAQSRETWLNARLEECPVMPLEDLLSLQHGRPFSSDLYADLGVPLLRPGDMRPDGLTKWSSNTVRIPEEWATKHPDYVLKPRDLVINMTAQSLEDRFLGRVCQVTDRAMLNQRLGRLRLNEGVDREWILLGLRTGRFASWVAQRSEGSKVKHMHWRHIASYPFPWPSPADQTKLLNESGIWADTSTTVAREVRALGNLQASVRSQLLDGPHDF